MRDIVAGLIAIGLLLVAASLATTLHFWRRRRVRAHDAERARGRTIVAEIPTHDELKLFSEDAVRFYYGERAIDKDLISAVRVLINGSAIAAVVSQRHARSTLAPGESSRSAASGGEAPRAVDHAPEPDLEGGAPGVIEDRPEGIARDRWDVAIETVTGTVLVECGAIRERISQELARTVFEAVKRDLDD